MQFEAAKCASDAVRYEQPDAWQQCCAAAGWLRQRVAASYRAQHDFYLQIIQQVGHGELTKRWKRGCLPAPALLLARLHRPADHLPCTWRPAVRMCHLISSTLPAPYPLQGTEELAAAEARRPAVIAAEPTLHIDLSEALQQQQPRVDMCRACARWLEQVGRRGAGRIVKKASCHTGESALRPFEHRQLALFRPAFSSLAFPSCRWS